MISLRQSLYHTIFMERAYKSLLQGFQRVVCDILEWGAFYGYIPWQPYGYKILQVNLRVIKYGRNG